MNVKTIKQELGHKGGGCPRKRPDACNTMPAGECPECGPSLSMNAYVPFIIVNRGACVRP